MEHIENALNIITAETYKGVTKSWIVTNLKGNESVDEIVSLLKKDNKYNEDFESKKRDIKEKISALENCCDGIVALGDKNFPQCRGNVKEGDQPTFLFYKGNLDLLNKNNLNITVIGLLNPDPNIVTSEKMVTEKIIEQNAIIVSGLALGCDSIAHKTALEKNGKTIAILPSPLNNILPASNKQLAYEIVEEGGLLITEYYDDFKNPKYDLIKRYSDRDRLQALYCDAIVLAASYSQDSAKLHPELSGKLDSGARLAMDKAKKYGIKRAVIYNDAKHADNPMFDLNRQIIKDDKNAIVINSANMAETIPKLCQVGGDSQLSIF
jgi:DNA processing protein